MRDLGIYGDIECPVDIDQCAGKTACEITCIYADSESADSSYEVIDIIYIASVEEEYR